MERRRQLREHVGAGNDGQDPYAQAGFILRFVNDGQPYDRTLGELLEAQGKGGYLTNQWLVNAVLLHHSITHSAGKMVRFATVTSLDRAVRCQFAVGQQ